MSIPRQKTNHMLRKDNGTVKRGPSNGAHTKQALFLEPANQNSVDEKSESRASDADHRGWKN